MKIEVTKMTDRETLITMLTKVGVTFVTDVDSVSIEHGMEYVYFIFDTEKGELIEVDLGSSHYSL